MTDNGEKKDRLSLVDLSCICRKIYFRKFLRAVRFFYKNNFLKENFLRENNKKLEI